MCALLGCWRCPFLRPQTRADGLQPHTNEYYRLMARMPLCVERSVLVSAPRMDMHVPRVFKHGEPGQSAYQRLRVDIDVGHLPADRYVAGFFSLRRSPFGATSFCSDLKHLNIPVLSLFILPAHRGPHGWPTSFWLLSCSCQQNAEMV